MSSKRIIFNYLFQSVIAVGIYCAALSVSAQQYSYIIHKPTGYKFYSCSDVDGTAITAVSTNTTSDCAHWAQIPIGDYFLIQNKVSGKNIRPQTSENGSEIVVRPSNWRGNWTQWIFDSTGDGYGFLKNRATGKHVFVAQGAEGENLQQAPSSWQGDYTRWLFEPVSDDPIATGEWFANITGVDEEDEIALHFLGQTRSFTLSGVGQQFSIEFTQAQLGQPFEFTLEARNVPSNITCVFANGDNTISSDVVQNFTLDVNCTRPVLVRRPAISQPGACEPSWDFVEMEASVLSGITSTYSDTSASGGEGVRLDTAGAGVTFSVFTSFSTVGVQYAAADAGQISLRVDGGNVEKINFMATGDLVDEYAAFPVNSFGTEIEVFFQTGDTPISLDYAGITGPPVPCPTPTPSPFPNNNN